LAKGYIDLLMMSYAKQIFLIFSIIFARSRSLFVLQGCIWDPLFGGKRRS